MVPAYNSLEIKSPSVHYTLENKAPDDSDYSIGYVCAFWLTSSPMSHCGTC